MQARLRRRAYVLAQYRDAWLQAEARACAAASRRFRERAVELLFRALTQ